MHANRRRPRISLPKSWPRHVKSAVHGEIVIRHAHALLAPECILRIAAWLEMRILDYNKPILGIKWEMPI